MEDEVKHYIETTIDNANDSDVLAISDSFEFSDREFDYLNNDRK